ncbi:hypothetical protein V8E53_015362 [Lactarius tabidus]
MQSSSQGTSWSVEELCDRAACTPCQQLCHAAWNGEPCTCKDGCPHLARRDDRMDTHWRVASQHLDVRGSQHVPGTDTRNIPVVAIMSASATNNTRLSAAKQTRPSAETKTCYADVSGPLRRPNPSKRKSTLSSSSHTRSPLSPTRAPLTSRSHLMPTLGPHVRTQTATYAVWERESASSRSSSRSSTHRHRHRCSDSNNSSMSEPTTTTHTISPLQFPSQGSASVDVSNEPSIEDLLAA